MLTALLAGGCWLITAGILIGLILGRGYYLERKAIIARAEQQHRWWMAGDDRGFYGNH